jgi:hypothetical protein
MKNKIIFKTLMLKGEAGSTIVSMEKTGHVGTADIYTITFNDGSTTEISLENMSAITSVEKTSSTDTEDIYTITCADGSTQTFSVLNHNADIAAMSDDIDTIDARVDNFINSVVPNTVETLWTGSIKDVGDSATLSKAVSNFDYIDLYLLGSSDSKYIRVPATQTDVQIQQQNLSDDASSNFLRLWEMGVSISGSTVSITKSIAWAWDDPNNSNPTVTANAQNGVPITRIDGVKVASDTPAEVTDIRVGADGTTYNSAGAAVRGQLTDKVDVDGYHQITPENIYGVQITGNLFNDAELLASNKYVNVSDGQLVLSTLDGYNSYIIKAYPTKYSFTYARFALKLKSDKSTAVGALIANAETIDNTDGEAEYIAFSFNTSSFPVSSYVVSIGETLDPSDKAYELPDWMIYKDTKPKASRISGNMGDGGSLIISDSTAVETTTNLRKGERIAYYADITSFSRVEVGLSYNKSLGSARINRVVVDDTNVSVYTIGTAVPPTITAHGLTIANNIQILLEVLATRQMKLTIISNGESFSQTYAWSRDAYGMPYALSDGSVLTGCELSWTCKDIYKDIWIFGDSYLQYDVARWTYYLHSFGYDDNALLDGYAGQASGAGVAAIRSLLNYGTPKYAIWVLGMNDGSDTDDSTPKASWITNRDKFLGYCTANDVEPIFGTIPTVPSINNNAKNAWIRSSGYRYIDFAKAVGADGTGAWYSGMLSSDNVHPTEKGAKALCMQCLADFPEIMVDN